jgi:hypothetical protein
LLLHAVRSRQALLPLGGRFIWQLADARALRVCRAVTHDEDPTTAESRLIDAFRQSFGPVTIRESPKVTRSVLLMRKCDLGRSWRALREHRARRTVRWSRSLCRYPPQPPQQIDGNCFT